MSSNEELRVCLTWAPSYQTQREPEWMRNILRARRVREALGGDNGLLEKYPPKPKGMHRHTHKKMCMTIGEAELQCFPPGFAPEIPEELKRVKKKRKGQGSG